MPGIVCSVFTCKSNSVQAKKEGKHLNFFNFPKDLNIRKQWISKCIKKDKWDPTNKRVCSKHFLPEDYEDNMKAKILGVPPKRLKRDAVPSQYLPDDVKEEDQCADEMMVTEWIDEDFNYSTSEFDEDTSIKQDLENNLNSQRESETEIESLKCRIEELEKENNYLKKFKDRAMLLERREMKLQDKISELEKSLNFTDHHFENKVKYFFRDLLTPKQLDVILCKKSKSRWTIEDFCRAYTLKYMSRRTYIYLRRYLKYPLPGISTLEKWVACMKRRGIWDEVMHLVKTRASIRTRVVPRVSRDEGT